jgi:hypothetical protein
MKLKELVENAQIVAFAESVDMADDLAAEGLRFDVDATTDAIVTHLLNDKPFLARLKQLDGWRAEELVVLAALDYFSSYEPVLMRMVDEAVTA